VQRQAAAGAAAANARAVPPAADAAPAPPAPLAETMTVTGLFPLLVRGEGSRQWMVDGPRIEMSVDAGKTWTLEYTAPGALASGEAVSSDVVWLVGSDGLVLRRTAAGWSRLAAPAAVDLTTIERATATELRVRGADGRVFLTLDAGATWSIQ
jgi:photosystem II stability/assembly factor-like uncharacterized protein